MNRNTAIRLVSISCFFSFAWVALAQGTYTKAYVADRIRKVEDGVEEFRKWAETKDEDAKSRAESAQSSGMA